MTKSGTPTRRLRRQDTHGSGKKITLYLGDIAEEVDKIAEKLGVSRSLLLYRAWNIAKGQIATFPGI